MTNGDPLRLPAFEGSVTALSSGQAWRSGTLDARRPSSAGKPTSASTTRLSLAQCSRSRPRGSRSVAEQRSSSLPQPARHQLAADRAREARQEGASPQGRRSLRLRAGRRGSAGAHQGRRGDFRVVPGVTAGSTALPMRAFSDGPRDRSRAHQRQVISPKGARLPVRGARATSAPLILYMAMNVEHRRGAHRRRHSSRRQLAIVSRRRRKHQRSRDRLANASAGEKPKASPLLTYRRRSARS